MWRITLGDLDFNAAALAASGVSGSQLYCTELEGWDSPDLRQNIMPRAAAHGGVYLENFYEPRALVLRGVAIPADGVNVDTLDDYIAGQLHTPTGINLTVYETIPKYTTVRRASRYRSRRGPRHIEFEVDLIAVAVGKYSVAAKQEVVTVGAGASTAVGVLINDGTFPLYPDTITISGNATAPIEVEHVASGDKIIVTSNIATSQYVIYPYTRVVLYGAAGSEESHYETVDAATRWWEIDEWANTVRVTRASTTGTLTVTIDYKDAWI